MSGGRWPDDPTLLSMLGEALAALRTAPPGVVDAGTAAYAWRRVDLELPTLTCAPVPPPNRVSPASDRQTPDPRPDHA